MHAWAEARRPLRLVGQAVPKGGPKALAGYGLLLHQFAEACADALTSLLDGLRLSQAIVVGISGGGPTALQLAGRHPERVSLAT